MDAALLPAIGRRSNASHSRGTDLETAWWRLAAGACQTGPATGTAAGRSRYSHAGLSATGKGAQDGVTRDGPPLGASGSYLHARSRPNSGRKPHWRHRALLVDQ